MLPLYDNVPASRRPYVTIAIILVSVALFIYELSIAAQSDVARDAFIYRFGFVPARLSEFLGMSNGASTLTLIEHEQLLLPDHAAPALLTLLTCLFLHGGVLHLGVNMFFLWIFGDNVEDRLGRVRFLLFYVGAGVVASLTHWLTDPWSTIPTIGASGAIAAVMGAYLVAFPRAQIMVMLPPFIFFRFWVPAFVFLILWLVLQLQSGLSPMAKTSGVAVWAHVGGFIAGVGLGFLMRARANWKPVHYQTAR